ncbi:hypothetical protein PZA22_17330 [Pectobacterium polaris]|uniref:hypothetical protein n=1 Tax=Pectobacterium polaris TaxID=2042057 RepID=UPI00202D3619|nr:hypothetical protein [Pectobacterium polaris]MCL6339256.1 hypothetical protein [Pectobacterium carotovorum subsp. carotovorum]MCL6343515.1 hypothetical protein [Pectobacterium carotovorum subsp. carotovorum]MDE8756251.1 hypothetical protein [Pectobacterium polaris]GKX37627.1 hypothetical protein SOASR014_13660 [Pectobacterium carotovorum subsp. carotovorum]GLX44176.1 hypothetical protein Pcaca01_18440 [Pectobacterium carotovorum subsp. carotovorum]
MNNAPTSLKRTAATVSWFLIYAWLSVLTVFIGLSYRTIAELAERKQVDASMQQIRVLEESVTELADSMQVLQTHTLPASATALRELQQNLENRLAQIEQMQENQASTQSVQTLRDELERLKSQQAVARPSPSTTHRTAGPATTTPRKMPFPFRILGLELRAGQRMVSLAPASGKLSSNQIQLVSLGETVDQWRLDAIEGDTAIFSRAGQTRRLAIP